MREDHRRLAATIHGQTTKGPCGVLTSVRLFARVEAACCAIVGDRGGAGVLRRMGDIAIEFDAPDSQRELPFVDGFQQQIRVLLAWIGEGSRLSSLYTIFGGASETTRLANFFVRHYSLLNTLRGGRISAPPVMYCPALSKLLRIYFAQ